VVARLYPNVFKHLSTLANETNLVHNFFWVYFINIIIISTCFGPLQVHHQEELLYFMWHVALVFCIADCLVCRILRTRQSAIQNTSATCHIKYSSSSWWWTWRGRKHVEFINNIDEIHWEKILRSKWVSFARLCGDGHKGPVLRPRCIGPVKRARTLISSYVEMHGQQNLKKTLTLKYVALSAFVRLVSQSPTPKHFPWNVMQWGEEERGKILLKIRWVWLLNKISFFDEKTYETSAVYVPLLSLFIDFKNIV
jgi:hypothetical protein